MARPTEPIHRETAKHRAAFEIWYTADRDYKAVMKDCNVSMVSVYHWIEWFGWRAKADARDLEVEKRNAKAAIARKAQMVEDHRKAGELVRKRGVEYFAKNAIKTEGAALSAIGKGIEIERTAEGMPAWMVAMMGMDDVELAQYIAAATGAVTVGDGPAAGEGTGDDDPERRHDASSED